MQVIKYAGIEGGNFGDDLNLLLWRTLFPDLDSISGRAFLYGIGTVLGGRHDTSVKKVVLGAGIGESSNVKPDCNWDFRWVRGPLTAAEFGLPDSTAIGDAATLWPGLTPGHNTRGPVGLVPHYATWRSFDWADVAERAGMVAIDPGQSPSKVALAMQGCSRIITESLHGGIFADAMGIPWAPCILAHRFNAFKWRDWMATISREYAPIVMDRPLAREVSPHKAFANRMARLIHYKRHTRYPALRPVRASTEADIAVVSGALRHYAAQESLFFASKASATRLQRQKMVDRCGEFARDYGLAFNPL
jgi:succinoglycan biosynthesis protein ExoV